MRGQTSRTKGNVIDENILHPLLTSTLTCMHTTYRQAYTPTHILKNIQINTYTKKNVHTEAERDRQSREREKCVANWLPVLKVVGTVSIDSDFSIKRSII